jgi:hypothetical protein
MDRSTLKTRSLDNEMITACNEYMLILGQDMMRILRCDELKSQANQEQTHAVYNAL